MNLAILAGIFNKIGPEDFLDYVRSKPTGKYARRLWFLYEFLTGTSLRIDDVKQGNYIDLLDPDQYYTVTPARQIRRQRINDNLLGDSRFCPTIRRTDILKGFEAADLPGRCREILSSYSPELLKRTLPFRTIRPCGYSYIDMTPQAEALFRFIKQTIDTELVEELEFLANYNDTKRAIQEIVDMPDRQIDLFIRFCLHNNGLLSVRKRASHFDFLSEDEIILMEQAIQSAYGNKMSKKYA